MLYCETFDLIGIFKLHTPFIPLSRGELNVDFPIEQGRSIFVAKNALPLLKKWG